MHGEPLDSAPAWRRLLHRWLVQYNPLYLVSAALVLFGVIQISSAAARTPGPLGQLAVTGIAEAYAWALILGAAWSTRIGLRRPAVMLALLTAAYQCDPTLHTSTCAYLGDYGLAGTAVWLAMFFAKLRAVAWAVRLRLSSTAMIVPMIGALGIAIFPWVLREIEGDAATWLVTAWFFGLLATGLWTSRAVTSIDGLTPWGRTVLGRSTRATWIGWAVMAGAHLMFWMTQGRVASDLIPPVAILLATRGVRRERSVWVLAAAALGVAVVVSPHLISVTAAMIAAVLLLRAYRRPHVVTPVPADATSRGPYREIADAAAPVPTEQPAVVFVVAGRVARLRLIAGALGFAYLSLWTLGSQRGLLPPHVPLVDLLLLVAAVIAARALACRAMLLLPAAAYVHVVAQLGLIAGPQSRLQWGITCVAGGFALLVLSLFATTWLHRRRPG